MMKIEIKHTISIEEYSELRKAVGWIAIESAQAQRGIQNTTYLVTAVDCNKTVGLARLVGDGGYVAIIADVIVLPEYQGKGIGKLLMENVMDYIKSNLEDGQTVMVNLMSKQGKEDFYKKFGFIERPNDAVGAGMHQWVKAII